MTYVMITCARKYCQNGNFWLAYFRQHDIHKWIIALEHGANGYPHWQIRYKGRELDTKEKKEQYLIKWKWLKPQAHIEFSENWCDYERKEGNFVCSEDNKDILSIRYGTKNALQRDILSILETQSDRQIDVWLDKKGNHGKTWLSLHLYERGLALIVPRYCGTAREISNFICSSYNGQKYVIIDIPRASRIKPEIYEAIEEIKDGLVSDPRYSGRTRNIRGARLVVFTNTALDTKKLSADRWRLHGIGSARGAS